MTDRKGLGYSIEVIAAIFVLLTFAAGSFSVPPNQDWRDYQRQIAAQDLTYTLENTGHLPSFLEHADTGSIQTAMTTISDRDMAVSGTVHNLPILESRIGFNTLPKRRFYQPLKSISGDRCEGDVEEIAPKSEYQVMTSDPSGALESSHGVRLYFADTDPKVSGGWDGSRNYDSVWVDNGTQCQFGAAEGPYYLDQFFFWGNGSAAGGTYSTDFEGSDPDWYCSTTNQNMDTCTTDANDHYSSPNEAAKAGKSDGVCGRAGVTKDFSFSQQPTTLTLDMKARADNWGRNTIMLRDSSGYHVLWRRKASGTSYSTGWNTRTFDISSYDSDFTLILGNDDDTSYCNNGDHGWTLWVDDVSVQTTDPAHYDFKSVDTGSNEFTVYRADQVVRLRNTMSQQVNGIDTDTAFDTFRIDQKDLSVYDVVVFRESQSLNNISTHRPKIESFMRQGSMLLMMNPSRSQVESGFLHDIGFEWVDLNLVGGNVNTQSGVSFSELSHSGEVETYFLGQDGNPGTVDLAPGAKIASNMSDTITDRGTMLHSDTVYYDRNGWNATNMNMNDAAPPVGAPSSSCNNYAEGMFTFPEDTYSVLNTELGTCKDVFGLNIDKNADGDFGDQGEGPFLNGETVVIDNRAYKVRIYSAKPGCADGKYCAEFVFTGSSRAETVNYRTEFNDFTGKRLARMAYEPSYSNQDHKVIASVLYWLRGDQRNFESQDETTPISTSVFGSIDNNVFMPYKVNLRWTE